MKQLRLMILLITSCLVFGGCPYQSVVPIDVPSIKINPNLLGRWVDSENKDDIYNVSQKDEVTYKIVKTQTDSQEAENYLAYASIVNKTTFLNLWEIKEDENAPTFALYKIVVNDNNSIMLAEVTENIDEIFTSSAELKKFISNNMKKSYFFTKEELNLTRSSK